MYALFLQENFNYKIVYIKVEKVFYLFISANTALYLYIYIYIKQCFMCSLTLTPSGIYVFSIHNLKYIPLWLEDFMFIVRIYKFYYSKMFSIIENIMIKKEMKYLLTLQL